MPSTMSCNVSMVKKCGSGGGGSSGKESETIINEKRAQVKLKPPP